MYKTKIYPPLVKAKTAFNPMIHFLWNCICFILGTYCDPLGDSNVYGSLYPIVGEVKDDSIIMAATKVMICYL